MPVLFDELGRKLNKSGVTYPAKLMNDLGSYNDRTVMPDSVMVDDLVLPGIFLFCPESDIDYFRISKSIPEPDLQFRYLQLEYLSIVEIILRFSGDRELVLHVNPAATKGKRFLRDSLNTEILSFHFVCAQRNILASSFTNFDQEQLDWFKRNCERSALLKHVPQSLFSIASEDLSLSFKSNQNYYKYGGNTRRRNYSRKKHD